LLFDWPQRGPLFGLSLLARSDYINMQEGRICEMFPQKYKLRKWVTFIPLANVIRQRVCPCIAGFAGTI